MHRKRLVQAPGKTMLQKLFTLHITAGGDGNHRNVSGLRDIRGTQQFQQIETIYCRHLYIRQQDIKSICAQSFQQFVQLQASDRSYTTLREHGGCKRELDAVVINKKKFVEWRVESGEWRVGCTVGGCAIMLHRTLNSQLSTLNFSPSSYRIQRHPQRKRTSFSKFTFHLNPPFEQLHQHTDDGQAQSETFLTLCSRQAGELLEDAFTVIRLHTLSRIDDGEFQVISGKSSVTLRHKTSRQRNAAFRGEFHRIGKQIVDYLAQT